MSMTIPSPLDVARRRTQRLITEAHAPVYTSKTGDAPKARPGFHTLTPAAQAVVDDLMKQVQALVAEYTEGYDYGTDCCYDCFYGPEKAAEIDALWNRIEAIDPNWASH